MKRYIGFNKPHLTGNEVKYIKEAVESGKISGNGAYTEKCQNYFMKKMGIKKALLTNSCTDALEMSAILIDVKPGDEIIMPSYTFVSTANAFILRGANIVFVDSYEGHPNIDPEKIEQVITPKTKAIVAVHYAGVACDMDRITEIAQKHNLFVIEDAAQAIDSFYKGKPLGSIGDLATFSFHETKNIIAGEGGLLAINNERFIERSEIIWEKGTNRSAFFRGEVNKYGWVDIGSSYLPSEVTAAFLWAQLENVEKIQNRRESLWNKYHLGIQENTQFLFPVIPKYATNNAHMFYLVCTHPEKREHLIGYLRDKGVHAVFHYQSLHGSEYYKEKHGSRQLPNCDNFSDCLVRLPLYYDLKDEEIDYIIETINAV